MEKENMMIEVRATVKINLCCAKCRIPLKTKPIEPSRGGRNYDKVVLVETCRTCQRELFELALDNARKGETNESS